MSQSEKVSLYSKVGQAAEDGDEVQFIFVFKAPNCEGRRDKLLVSATLGTALTAA